MGEYARLNKMIKSHEDAIKIIDWELQWQQDKERREALLEEKYELQIGIGEIKGALLEMADMDGLDDLYEAFD